MNNKKIISLILGCMCILLTYGITAQIKTIKNIGTTTGASSTENELKTAILKSKEKYDNLYNELDDLEKRLEAERANSTKNNSELEELENSIKEANKLAGYVEVTGPGVIVTLDDNKKTSYSNYLGDPNELIVHYNDVIRVVNELKNTGAEAISVNDQRIIGLTSIECDGNVIKVNGVKVGTPFVIKAIGLPEYLTGALNRYGGYLMLLRENYGIEAPITKSENITIPKYTGVIKFDYAQNQ